MSTVPGLTDGDGQSPAFAVISLLALWLWIAGMLVKDLYPRFTKAMQVFVILMGFCLLAISLFNAYQSGN
jgi:hypothetical protein